SDQRRQGLVISLEARQPDPDLFLMDVIWIGQFAHSEWLESFDSYIKDSNFSLEPFFERILRLVDRYDNQLFALPVYIDGGVLYYRTDLLKRFGYENPPVTWQQLLVMAERIQTEIRKGNPAFNGFVWQGAQYEGLVCNFLEFASSHGGGLISGKELLLNSDRNTDALQFMHDLIHRYRISPQNIYTEMKEEEVRRSFQRGNALFERNWPYAWSLHQSDNSPVQGKTGIAPLPHFEGYETASTLGGWHIGISRFSDRKRAAWQVVKYITSYEIQKKLVLNLGWNPGRKDLYADETVLEQVPHLERLREVFEFAVARPNIPYYTQVSEVIQRYVNRCLAGRTDAQTALKNIQEEIGRIKDIYEIE
ncbi:MAG: ABC transporter substrate-binding protein, partial [Calditrichaeota bacterium]